jgi:hypothetical protein
LRDLAEAIWSTVQRVREVEKEKPVEVVDLAGGGGVRTAEAPFDPELDSDEPFDGDEAPAVPLPIMDEPPNSHPDSATREDDDE